MSERDSSPRWKPAQCRRRDQRAVRYGGVCRKGHQSTLCTLPRSEVQQTFIISLKERDDERAIAAHVAGVSNRFAEVKAAPLLPLSYATEYDGHSV